MGGRLPEGLFGTRTLGIDLRAYQRRVLATLEAKRAAGDRRLHLVAPPGSGKTLLGLALAEAIGEPAVVLCPNTTIQAQWPEKAERFLVELDDLAERLREAPPLAVSTALDTPAPITVLTYQLLTAQAELPAEARPLPRLAARGVRTLVLDECHHLTGRWADEVLDFLDAWPDTTVIGLTATPPVDRSRQALGRYLAIVGEVDEQIPLPAVVRDGLLAPFQDLARFVVPTAEEAALVRDEFAGFAALLDELEAPPEGLDSLSLWVEQRLLAPRWKGRARKDFLDLWLEAPHYAAALVRYVRHRGLTLPGGIIDPDEVPQPAGLEDFALVVEDYVDEHLRSEAAAGEARRALATRAEKVLEAHGFVRERGHWVRRSSPTGRVLASSAARLSAMREILVEEAEVLGDELRALVLTDFVHSDGHRGVATDGGGGPGGALAAFHTLLGDPRTDLLDPILVTGDRILADDELDQILLEEGQRYLDDRGLRATLRLRDEGGHYAVVGDGPDWGTRTYVSLVTDLLRRGRTRCVVGTRALLGEGWDCEPLNTLVDLTEVAAFVSVNQIRGRTLRLDPNEPMKTANNWDVVTLLAGVPGGEEDLERFLRKHKHFYGPTDDGDLEKGAGHVHPAFSHLSRDDLHTHIDTVNEDLRAAGRDRMRAFEVWRVGEAYRDEEVQALELAPVERPEERSAGRSSGRGRAPVEPEVVTIDPALCAQPFPWRFKKTAGVATGLGLVALLATLGAAFQEGEWLFAVLAGLVALASPWLPLVVRHADARRAVRRAVRPLRLAEWLAAVGDVLRDALVRSEILSPTSRVVLGNRSDGSRRLSLEGGSVADSERFAEALRELLGPYEEHRYVLLTKRPTPPRRLRDARRWQPSRDAEPLMTFPIPAVLGRHREHADALAKAWSERLGPAEALYVRARETREERLPLLLPLLEQRPRLRRFVKKLWR